MLKQGRAALAEASSREELDLLEAEYIQKYRATDSLISYNTMPGC